MASLLDIGKNLKNRTNPIVKAMQDGLQQTQLAKISYDRQRSQGATRGQQIGQKYIMPKLQQTVNFINARPNIQKPLMRASRFLQSQDQSMLGQFGSGIAQGSNMGFGRAPLPAPTTGRGNKAYTAGSLLGAFNPKSITGKVTGSIVRATNPILAKAVSPVANKAITGRLVSGAANVAQGAAINPLYGRKPLEGAALDFVSGAAFGPSQFGARGMAKGFDFGRNKNMKWNTNDVNELDQITDFLRKRKLTPEDLVDADEAITKLARGYLPVSVMNKLASDYGKNSKGYLRAMVKELDKSAKRLGAYEAFDELKRSDDFDIPNLFGGNVQMGVVNKAKIFDVDTKQFSEPYNRGDISQLEKQLDQLLGVSDGLKYRQQFAERLNQLKQLEQAAESGNVDAQRYLPAVQTLMDDIERAKSSRLTPSIPKAPPSLSGTAKQIQQSAPTAGMPGANVSLPKQSINQLSPQKTGLGNQPQGKTNTSPNQGSLDSIIAEGRKQIGSSKPEPKQSVRQAVSDAYTQWVDRYHPIVSAAGKAKKTLKSQAASLRPEYDPEYLVRRLTGAGGIADARFRNELEPIIKQLDDLAIPKADLDVYLANKRIAGFGKAGREVYGADVTKANQIIGALEAKYGQNIRGITDQLYGYQNKGFQEMVEAGFMSPETAKLMQQENPDYSPLYRVMDEVNDYLGLPTRKAMQGSQPIKKIKGSKRQIESPLESIIGNTFSQRAAIEKNRVAKSIIDLQNITDLGFKQAAKSGDSTITVWKNGQKEYWDVGKDIADVAKGTNEEAMNMVLKIIQAPASLLRQGATGRNPEFMIPNIIRDQLDAGVTSKYGYVPFLDYVSGLKSMLAKDDVYKAWERSGAKIDLGEMSGKKSIAKYFDEKTAKKGLFSWLGAGLDVAGKYSEQPTRLGLFKKAYNKTGNEMLAMMESRDSTVDFARMGAKMKVANSIIPFLNVSVQGFDKLIRATKNNPGKVLFNAALYGAGPAAAVTAYNLNFHPEEYAEIPQYEKDSNFVLVKGRNANGQVDYMTTPKGNIIPTIANPIQSFMEFAAQNSQQDFKQMALTLLSTTLPVVGEGQSLQEIATKTIGSNLPQAIKPAAENLVNKSFYKYDTEKEQSKEIVPYYLQDKPDYQQDYEFTPVMYKKIGALINASPLKVQNIMEGYLAGYSKIPSNIIQSLTKVSRGEEISPNETILMRRFIKQTYPGGEKKTTEKPVSPGVMDRITGKTSAASAGIAQTIPSDPEEAKIFYKQALQEINNAKANRIKYTYDSSLTEDERKKKLDGEMEKNIRAVNTINQMRKQNSEQVFEVEAKTHSSSGGRTVDARASWVNDQLSKAKTKSEKESLINKLYEANVLTKSVVQELNKKFNLNINKYVSNGQIKSFGGKGKKIAIKKVTTTPFKLKSTKKISFRNKIPKAKITKTKGYRVLTYVDKTPTVKVSKPVVRWS